MSIKHDNLVKLTRIKLTEEGCLTIQLKPGKYRSIYSEQIIDLTNQTGWPDVLAIGPCGQCICAEIKIDRDIQRAEQRNFQIQAEKRSAKYVIIRSEEDVKKLSVR